MELDNYLKKKAYIDMLDAKSVTYLLFKDDELFGFYTLNISQVEEDEPNDDEDIRKFKLFRIKIFRNRC